MNQPQPSSPLPLPKYKRKRAVEDQIRALPPVESPECLAYVRQLGRGLFPETLVWLFRASQFSNERLLDAVIGCLIGHFDQNGKFHRSVWLVFWREEIPQPWMELETYLVRHARSWDFAKDLDELNDFRARSHVHILREISKGATRKPFWEVYFSRILKFAMLDLLRAIRREQEKLPELVRFDPDLIPRISPSAEGFEQHARAFEEAVLALPEKERIVLELLFMDPTAPGGERKQKEVAEILEVDVKTIYNRLKSIRARFKDDPRLNEMSELLEWTGASDALRLAAEMEGIDE